MYWFDLLLDKKEFISLQFYIEVTKKIHFIGIIAVRLIVHLLYLGWLFMVTGIYDQNAITLGSL